LVGYDAGKGYTFSKDGVVYKAHCAGFTGNLPKLPDGYSLDGWRPILSPTPDESACSAVLSYLHKLTPVKQGIESKDVLTFAKDRDGSLTGGFFEFVITEAK
jgi:hypothetical protein